MYLSVCHSEGATIIGMIAEKILSFNTLIETTATEESLDPGLHKKSDLLELLKGRPGQLQKKILRRPANPSRLAKDGAGLLRMTEKGIS
jgi:hypothetical protein